MVAGLALTAAVVESCEAGTASPESSSGTTEESVVLVLTRKLNEGVRIGNDVVVRVTRINPYTVKLGIEAPRHVRVMRDEVYLENKAHDGNERTAGRG